MTDRADLNQTLLSSLQSGDEQSSDDEIKTLNSSSADFADIDTTLASPRYSSSNVQTVYNELLLIRTRLCEENDRLKKKADLLNQWEQRMRETIEQGWQAHKMKFDAELNNYKEKFGSLSKDLKRTNEALQVLREQNSELKRNLTEARESNEKLGEKAKQAEKRAENLVRLNQISEQKIKELERTIDTNNRKIPVPHPVEESSKSSESSNPCRSSSTGDLCYEHPPSTTTRKLISNEDTFIYFPRLSSAAVTSSKPPSIASTDSLIFLFNWLSDTAQTALAEWPSTPSLTPDTLERYSKLLSILADQSSYCFNRNHSALTLSYLKLVYFSLITIECPTTSGQTRHLYSCSYRRLCEQILKCDKNQVGISFER